MAGRDSDRRQRRRHPEDLLPHSSSARSPRSVVVQREDTRTSASSRYVAEPPAARRPTVPPTPPSPPPSVAATAASRDLRAEMTPYRRPTVYETEQTGRYKYSGRRRSGSEVNPIYEDSRYQRRPRPEDLSTEEEEDIDSRDGEEAVSSEPEDDDEEEEDQPAKIIVRARRIAPVPPVQEHAGPRLRRRTPSVSSGGSLDEDQQLVIGGAALSPSPAPRAPEPAPIARVYERGHDRGHERPTVVMPEQSQRVHTRTPHRRPRRSDPVVVQESSSRKARRPKHHTPRSDSGGRSSSRHRSSVMSSIWSGSTGYQPSPERRKSRVKTHERTPSKIVECIICTSETRSSRAPKLRCGHRMCHACLKRNFELSLTDQQLMPPRCCTKDMIPLKHVEGLFDNAFKKRWNRKYEEFSTHNRLYCPSRRCGEWIQPSLIRREGHRKSAKCGHCKTKVCVSCNGKWHSSYECPRDEETQQFLRQAKQEGWQRCHACKYMVERQQGCNHMTCRCGAQFCMLCGSKWKSCDCEWFNFAPIEGVSSGYPEDRRAPMEDFSDSDGSPSPRGPRDLAGHRDDRIRRRGHENYHRRIQEEHDAEMAHRMQYEMSLEDGPFDNDINDNDDDDDDDELDMMGGVTGLGLTSGYGHHANEHYRYGTGRTRSRHSPPSPTAYDRQPGYRTPPRSSYDRGGYVMDVSRARGVRGDSMERRLADRLSEHRHGGPPPPIIPGGYHVPPHPASAGMEVPSMMGQGVPPPPMGPYPPMRGPPIGLPTSSSAPMMTGHHPAPHAYSSVSHHSPAAVSTAQFPGPAMTDYPPMVNRTPVRRRESDGGAAPRSSASMAGLSSPGNGASRVMEWNNFVEPGVPDERVRPHDVDRMRVA